MLGKVMNRIATIVLLSIVSSLTIFAASLLAQVQEPIRLDLAKLDRQLAEAAELLASFPNSQARDILLQAKQLRDQAAANIQNNRLIQARLQIRTALQYIDQALKLALDAPAQRLKSQLEELMRQAEIEVIGSGNREAEQLLQQAKKSQASAEQAWNAGNSRRAVDFYRLATNFAQKALELVRANQHNTGGLSTADNGRQQFENLAARAREAIEITQNGAARAIYDQAMKQAQTAELYVRSGRAGMAIRLYSGAIRLLLRAIDLAGGMTNASNRLESELTLLEDLVGSAEKQLEGKNDARATMLIGRARLLLAEARSALDRKDDQEAGWRLVLARSFVSKAMRSGIGGAFESRLEEELAQLMADLKELEQRAAERGNNDALEIAALARLAAGKAERAFANGRPRVSLQALLASQRFLAFAESLLSSTTAQELSRTEISQKLDRLDASLQEVSQSAAASNNEVAMDLVNQVIEIRDRSREALNRGRLRVASETIDVAMEMLRTALKASTSDVGKRNQ
jgi:hypothetical protein